ncbi:hypothetical protein IQ247_12350 [Plectonema cf. radiosum LEGE 06105]|uniref:Uncharacterized protein n=1 Tax=Plectonema cf. radiosum LEGE 06105 TaxID=945769 RepID=A0A8J7F0E0_9CYAN|nr:hypothetical protein [Plectonema radiosum]MBE9213448.1 hypothetical protein [Plectonema cf. radiosum LEGE 06105]
MLAQFQSLYPTGSLISELVQIYNGKYIVRSSVQIEGVTRATGMAAAETIEEAEDRARIRALMVLVTKDEPQAQVQQQVIEQKEVITSPQPNLQLFSNRSLSVRADQAVEYTNTNPNFTEATQTIASQTPITSPSNSIEVPQSAPSNSPEAFLANDRSDIYDQDLDKPLPIPTYDEPDFDTPIEDRDIMSDYQSEAEENSTPSNVTPINRSAETNSTQKTPKTSTTKRKKKTEPVDLSDVIAKTDVELERLGWTPQEGREYLINTYGKRGRTLLTEEELLDFLNYLESLPAQTNLLETDPLAGF